MFLWDTDPPASPCEALRAGLHRLFFLTGLQDNQDILYIARSG